MLLTKKMRLDPHDWSKTEMKTFLHMVSVSLFSIFSSENAERGANFIQHGIESTGNETRDELLGRCESVFHQPKF